MNMMRNKNRGGNRQRGGGGGRRYPGGGGGGNRNQNEGQNLARQKHHATQMLGKYSDMARNAQINGDRVDVEYYLQHVDHYNRVLADIAGIEAERFASRESQIIPGGPNDPNSPNYHGNTDGASSANGDAGAEGSTGGNGDFNAGNQPRMMRPRPQYNAPSQDGSNSGAQEAGNNSNEIPLPGGILPPI